MDVGIDSSVHFWALSLYRCQDYSNAGIPMLPVVRGQAYTKKAIFCYSLLLLAISLAPFALGFATEFYAASVLLLGLWFLYYVLRLMIEDGITFAPLVFKYSILYLFLLFLLLLLDKEFFYAA